MKNTKKYLNLSIVLTIAALFGSIQISAMEQSNPYLTLDEKANLMKDMIELKQAIADSHMSKWAQEPYKIEARKGLEESLDRIKRLYYGNQHPKYIR